MQSSDGPLTNGSTQTESDSAYANSKRGIAFAVPTQACRLVVHFASICILSRLLAPEDFGIAGMVLAVSGFLDLFKDGGLGIALVQAKSLPRGVVATLFWIVACISCCMGGLLLFSGSTLAWIFREPRVIELTSIFAIAIVANGLAVVPQALMRREFKFGYLAIIDLISMLLGVVAAISLAWNGYRYRALAFQPLVAALTALSTSWFFSPIWPGRPRWTFEIREAIRFGANLSGFSFVNYFARNLDNILIGRYWGASALGFYARAYTLLLAPINLINTPLAQVYVPILSRLQQRPEQFRIHYLQGLSLATMISLPLSATLIICAEEIVQLLLGSVWTDVVDIFRLLCISAPFQLLGNTTGWLYQSLGRTDRQFRWGLFASTVIVVSFFVGLPWGSRGVALSYSCAMIPITCLNFWYATRETAITVHDILRCCLPGVISATILGLILLGIKWIVLLTVIEH